MVFHRSYHVTGHFFDFQVQSFIPSAVCLDITDREAVHAAFEDVAEKHGGIDTLICVAGVMYFTLLKNLKFDEWDRTINTNVKGTVHCCGAALPHLLQSTKSPHIVAISSDAARQTFPALTV